MSIESLARNIMASDQGADFIRQIADKLGDTTLDLEGLKKEAEERKSPSGKSDQKGNQAFITALQQQMPNVKTQAHFDIVQSAFESLSLALNSYFGGEVDIAAKSREALEKLLDMASRVKDIDDTLKENPEATSNQDFVSPPREYTKQEYFDGLLADLEAIRTPERLKQWYAANRETLDGVTDLPTRNKIFDAIREKKIQLKSPT